MDADLFWKLNLKSTEVLVRDGVKKEKLFMQRYTLEGTYLSNSEWFIRDAKPHNPAINPRHIRP